MRPLFAIAALLLASIPCVASARSSQDQARVGQDITVAPGETSGDIACAFCSVRIHGDVKGDVAVFMGDIIVDDGQTISGDVAIFGGNLKLATGSHVGGDVAIAAGDAYAPAGTISGDRTVLPGSFWLLLPFTPIFILIGIIWLIVYLVRRNRYQFPAYPQGRSLPPRM